MSVEKQLERDSSRENNVYKFRITLRLLLKKILERLGRIMHSLGDIIFIYTKLKVRFTVFCEDQK